MYFRYGKDIFIWKPVIVQEKTHAEPEILPALCVAP